MRERYIEIHDKKYFKEDIGKMDKIQIKDVCSFLDKESDLLFVQKHRNEDYQYIIDNLLFKFNY